ncbi:MAG TPA: acyl-CoA dehydrogenase family protein, partial [Candidatus Elarobacter sp.]
MARRAVAADRVHRRGRRAARRRADRCGERARRARRRRDRRARRDRRPRGAADRRAGAREPGSARDGRIDRRRVRRARPPGRGRRHRALEREGRRDRCARAARGGRPRRGGHGERRRRERIAPHAAAWDKSHRFPREELSGMAALGCYGVAVPEADGGAGLDYLALAIILEEIAAGDGATSTIVSVNNCPVCSILMAFGNDDQKRRFLAPLARGEMLGAFCLTEPHVGSEAGGLKTTAVRDGDHYVLNGVKQFITSGKNGDVAIVMAVTDKAAGKKGISAFIVPTATPGYQVARIEDKMGQHASDTAQIVFDHCRVPATYLLADEGLGLKIALSGLEGGRIGIASQALGMARAAFEAALDYSKERRAFGQPIFEHQAVQFKL